MEAGFSLRKVNQILGKAFLLENRQHHVAIAPGTSQRALQDSASMIREVRDITRDLIDHHEWQVGMGLSKLSFGLGFCSGIGSRRYTTRLVDGCRFGLLLRFLRSLSLGGGSARINLVDPLDDAIEFLLETIVGADIQVTGKQRIQSAIKILFRLVCLTDVALTETRLI